MNITSSSTQSKLVDLRINVKIGSCRTFASEISNVHLILDMVVSVYEVIINDFRIKKKKKKKRIRLIKQVFDTGLLEFIPWFCICHL